jgi:hypothetical protein
MKLYERVPLAKDLNAVDDLRYTLTVQWNAKSARKERSAAMLYRQEKRGKIAIKWSFHDR